MGESLMVLPGSGCSGRTLIGYRVSQWEFVLPGSGRWKLVRVLQRSGTLWIMSQGSSPEH
jgi:hypothetical protein